MSPSHRLVLNNLPGTVLDVVQRARMPEDQVRARVAELRRSGLVRIADNRPRWKVYAPA